MLRGPMSMLEPEFKKGPLINYGNHHLSVRAIKIGADGALGSRGAALLEPYSDEPGTSGLMTTPPEEIYAQTLAASRAGFQTCIHAIGDRGNRVTHGCLRARAARGARARGICGCATSTRRFSTRPKFRASPNSTSLPRCRPPTPRRTCRGCRRASARRAPQEGAYVWQRLIRTGVVLANGSDFPGRGAQSDARLLRRRSRARIRPASRPADGCRRSGLSREEMLKSFTWNAAYAAHAEKDLGSLEVGKLADMVLLDKNVMTVEPKEIALRAVAADHHRRRGRLREAAMT